VRLTDLARHVVTLLDGAHSMNDIVESVRGEIDAGRAGNDRILRLHDGELNAVHVTSDILQHLCDRALLVA
jgi:hypothetical protein